MLARTTTATLAGLLPIKVEVEVDGNRGIPKLIFIGLPSQATTEAKERITSALQNCGIRIRSKRTIVNLAPADLPKQGTAFDLAIAVALLQMYGEIKKSFDSTLFLGELALDGKLKKVQGVLPLVLAAKTWGLSHAVIPTGNIEEVSTIQGIQIHPIDSLSDILSFCKYQRQLPTLTTRQFTSPSPADAEVQLEHIKGQDQAKRALMVAAAGGHHVLLIGPPGMGKTILTKSIRSLLPPLSEKEALELTHIYSLAGLNHGEFLTTRPFRSPHHTISYSALIGGGHPIKPGEISLAHRGVLFLDELLEHPRNNLEALRQPLEEGNITINRAQESLQLPARFQLLGATNPCPCGYHGTTIKSCHCSAHALQRYQEKLSGPLLDRFGISVQVGKVELEKVARSPAADFLTSAQAFEAISIARQTQLDRYQHTRFFTNAEVPSVQLEKLTNIADDALTFLRQASQKLNLSVRSYFQIWRVSQTIADLDTSSAIKTRHIAEALQFRIKEEKM